MKLLKKAAIIAFVIVCLAIIGNGIYLSQMGKTVDCSGTVDFVDLENKIIKITDENNVNYLLKVKFYTAVKDINNSKLSINQIEAGDIVTANFIGEWNGPDSELSATYIKVAK